MSSKKAMKKSQKQAFQKHKSNIRNSKFNPRINKFSFQKKKYFNKFEGTEEYYKKSISLPIYHDLKKNDLAYIIKVIKKFFISRSLRH